MKGLPRTATLALFLTFAAGANAELILSDQESEVYYHQAAAAGTLVQVEKDAGITGRVHSNGDVQLKKDSTVDGDVTAVGLVDVRGTVNGTVNEGAAALALPELLDEAAWRALADRVFEQDEVILTDEVVNDVVFVTGTVHLRGQLSGEGTVIALGDVRVDTTGNETFTLDPASRLSLIAGNDVRLGKDRPFRGVVRAGHDAVLEGGVDFQGVIVADNLVHVKLGARVAFVDFDEVAPVVELLSPPANSILATALPEIRVALSDDFSGLRLDSVELLLDGVDVTAQAVVGGDGTVTFTPTQPLADGTHTLEVAVSDHSDNEARALFEFTTDTAAPVVTITSPADGATVPDETIEVTGTVSDQTAVTSVTVNGQAASLAGNDFTATVALVPGPNTIVAEATDAAGNTGSATVSVTVATDVTPPSLTLTAPGPEVVNDSTPAVAVEFSDDDSGVDPGSLVVRIDGVPLTCTLEFASAVCEPTAAVAEGIHTASAEVRDRAGNPATASTVFESIVDPGQGDREAPAVLILSPDQSAIFDPQPPIDVRYSDASGLDLTTLSIEIDGVDLVAGCSVSAGQAQCVPPPLADGAHVLNVQIADVDLNVGGDSFTFFVNPVDAGTPRIAVAEPSIPTLLNETSTTIVVRYGAGDAALDLGSLAIRLDGADILATCATDASEARCPSTGLATGDHEVTASIADVNGTESSDTLVFDVVLDVTPPVVTLTGPAPDTLVVNDDVVTVSGTVADAGEIILFSIGGIELDLAADGRFSFELPLSEGPNAIQVRAVDRARNIGTAETSAIRLTDVTPPVITFEAPRGAGFLADPEPVVDLSYADPNGVDPATVAVRALGQAASFVCAADAGAASCTPSAPLTDGTVTLEATAADVFGNVATVTLGVAVDTVPVALVIDSPAEGFATRDAQVTVTGTASAGVSEVEVDGIAATLTGSTFSAEVPLREGRQMLVAVGRKANGNAGTAAVDVVRDLQAPGVRIDSPRDGLRAVTDLVTVTGLANDVTDISPPRVFVNGLEALVADGSFMVEDLPLVRGPNVIEAVAVDTVGNESRHSITVDFQPPVGARLLLESGNGQFQGVRQDLPEPLVVVVRDDLGNPVAGRLVRFEVSRNSGTLRVTAGDPPARVVQVPTDGSGRASVLLTLGDTAGEGNNRVRATAVGVAGEVEFCASALPSGPAQILMVDGDNQSGVVGQPLPSPLEVIVVDADGNRLGGVPVTFTVEGGGGTLDGQSSTVRATGADGIARVVLALGPEPGSENNVVSAAFAGIPGLPAAFTASGVIAGDPAETRFEGVVLDNGQQPIPGATVTIGETTLSAVTDAEGRFLIEGVPVGKIHLVIDPTASPRPETFPPLAFETVTIAGQTNSMGEPILLPEIDTTGSKIVGGSEDVTLVMEGVEGLTLTVEAGSATFPDGSATGRLTISQVHLDKVPMPPPNGSLFMPPAWTIQPAGVHFDPPARITIPNDGLAPGRVIDIFQFDHTLNEFINVGKGTVSNDGAVIVSDPGFGITRTGWGGCGLPPPPPTCADGCPECKKCENDSCVPTSGSCDDGDACTSFDGKDAGPDQCDNGTCKGTKIEDRDRVDLGLQEWDFSALRQALRGVAQAASIAPGCQASDPAFKGAIKLSFFQTCCDNMEQIGSKFGGQISVDAFGAECIIPGLSFNILNAFEAGVFAGVSVGGSFSGSGTSSPCDECNWEVSGSVGITFSGGLKVITKFDPTLLSVKGGLKGGGKVSATVNCDGFKGSGCAGPPVIFGEATFAGFLSKNFEFVPFPSWKVCL